MINRARPYSAANGENVDEQSSSWTVTDTEIHLSADPLPSDFTWRDYTGEMRAVCPVHALTCGFGAWLRATPYFPGLFDAIHQLLIRASDEVQISSGWIVSELRKSHRETCAGLGRVERMVVKHVSAERGLLFCTARWSLEEFGVKVGDCRQCLSGMPIMAMRGAAETWRFLRFAEFDS